MKEENLTSNIDRDKIKEWEKFYSENIDPEELEQIKQHLEEKAQFLDSIYRTGALNNVFSEEFTNAAMEEATRVSEQLNAINNILR